MRSTTGKSPGLKSPGLKPPGQKPPGQKSPGQKSPGQKPPAPSHLERASEWSGVRAGDPVEIAGMRARSTSWSFLAHVRNVRTGEEWVEVVGGRAGSRAVRSFRPEVVFAPAPRSARRGARATRAPLADSPRLPL